MFDHISVDFDGTLFVDGNVDKELVDKINAKYNGKVFIFTSRSWGDYYLIKNILLEAGLKFESLVCGKLMCGSYLDDRNLKIDEFKKTRKIPTEYSLEKEEDIVVDTGDDIQDRIEQYIRHKINVEKSKLVRCTDCKYCLEYYAKFLCEKLSDLREYDVTNIRYSLQKCNKFQQRIESD